MKKDRPLTTLQNVCKWLKLVAGMAASVVIIFKAISPIIGAVIIPLYLSNFSISISPAPDLSQQSQQIIGFELIALLAAELGFFFCRSFRPIPCSLKH